MRVLSFSQLCFSTGMRGILDARYESLVAFDRADLRLTVERVPYVLESHQRSRETVENDASAEAAAREDLVARIELAAIHACPENLRLTPLQRTTFIVSKRLRQFVVSFGTTPHKQKWILHFESRLSMALSISLNTSRSETSQSEFDSWSLISGMILETLDPINGPAAPTSKTGEDRIPSTACFPSATETQCCAAPRYHHNSAA